MTNVELITKAEDFAKQYSYSQEREAGAYRGYIGGFQAAQRLLQQTPCSTLRALLEQKLIEVQKRNAETSEMFVKEQTANDLYALRRVISLFREYQPVA